MEFRMSAREFLSSTCKKILTKCPLAYSLVRNMSSLDPREIVDDPVRCKANFRKVIVSLRNVGKVGESCDTIID